MQNNDTTFVKRMKSLAWRAGMMGLAAIVAFALAHLDVLQMSPFATTIAGLVLGEISKWLNTKNS